MLIDHVTPLLITLDEAHNITRTLDMLRWARQILVIDSGSTDGTLEIMSRYPTVKVVNRSFDSFAEQCNFGLAQIKTEWVLSLDADYELSGPLVQELVQLEPPRDTAGYRASFVYRIFGRPLRAALYPPRVVLYRVENARYLNEGHGHRLSIRGNIDTLNGVLYHDDRKPISRWFVSQQRYADREARHLLDADLKSLSRTDRLRRMAWPVPLLVLPYVLLFKGGVLDGWPGWFYALQRLTAEVMIALAVLDQRFSSQR